MKNRIKNPFQKPAVRLVEHIYRKDLSKEQRLLDEEITALSGMRRDAAFTYRVKLAADTMLLAAVLLLVCTVLTLVMVFGRADPQREQLIRDTYGGDTRSVELLAAIEGESEEQLHQIRVQPRSYGAQQVAQLLEQAKEEFERGLLGDNPKRDEVREDLCFPAVLQDGRVNAQYLTVPYGYIDQGGSLTGKADENGTLIEIRATFTCQDSTLVSETAVVVYPPVLTPSEKLFYDVESEVAQADEAQAESEFMLLPHSAAGREISWRKREGKAWMAVLILAPLAVAFYYLHGQQKVHEKAKKRRGQLEADYADLVWQLTMLLRAGMPIRTAFMRITAGYENRIRESGKRYVYEEMLYTCRELKNGRPENTAYEQFGRRCGLPLYIKLGTILSQNLRKGSSGLADMLEKEAQDSMEERKNLARKQGEKAGIKLIFPMLLMLLVVLTVLMVPAFFSLR